MATHAVSKFLITPFWNNEYKTLDYINEPFNDDPNVQHWLDLGFPNKFTGDMCDMRSAQPSFNHRFIQMFERYGWKDIGTSYYRMSPGTILPTHSDLYIKYVNLFDLQGKEDTIRRAIVFLENWQSGHYFEAMGNPMVAWTQGTCVEWTYDTPHMAANIGIAPRYTLQITGHV